MSIGHCPLKTLIQWVNVRSDGCRLKLRGRLNFATCLEGSELPEERRSRFQLKMLNGLMASQVGGKTSAPKLQGVRMGGPKSRACARAKGARAKTSIILTAHRHSIVSWFSLVLLPCYESISHILNQQWVSREYTYIYHWQHSLLLAMLLLLLCLLASMMLMPHMSAPRTESTASNNLLETRGPSVVSQRVHVSQRSGS